jgi:ATP-binding cassette subfamily F protein 3
MSVLRVQNVTVRFDGRLILREVHFKLAAGERVGLIGQNGTGKTTLIRLALAAAGHPSGDDLRPDDGAVDLASGTRVGYFSQFSELDGTRCVQEALEDEFAAVRAIEAELEGLFSPPLDDSAMERALERQALLLEQMELADGWNWRVQIDTALNTLGFTDTLRRRPIDQLSGGWRNRAALAKILLQAPDLLLLDEPTNYLDIDGVKWLEDWLRSFRGALLLVSHDREFLDNVVTRVVEVENHRLHDYDGAYSDYVREKPFRLKTLGRQFAHEEELLILEAEAIDDRRERLKNPSEALRRKLADVKKRAVPRPAETVITEIYQGLRARTNLLRVEDAAKGYGGQTLFTDLSFELHAGERLAIVGRNGSGKTTLLRLLTGDEAPDAGRVIWEGGVGPSVFNAVLDALEPGDTLSHAVNIVGMAYNAPRKQVHRFLEMLRFSEMDLKQRLSTLSGGQRARVALAQCLLSGEPVVILDEPTNHLDVPSIQVMEQALLHFPGAVVFVSHDRFFIDRVATRRLVFDGDGQVRQESV